MNRAPVPRNTEELAAATDTDFFFRVPHSMPWLSSAAVTVRQVEASWQYAISYDLGNTGAASPFQGSFTNRESAGKNGLAALYDALLHRRSHESRRPELIKAAELAAQVQNAIAPAQPLLNLF